MKLWIVFLWKAENEQAEFQGVFSSKELAVAACVEMDMCVCPCTLDERIPVNITVEWPGSWYPHLEAEPELA